MRKRVLLTVVVALIPAWGQTVLDSRSLYISDPLKWEHSQRPGQPAPKLALAGILAIEPDGKLAIVSCYLYKAPGNRLHIIYPEGFSLSSGTWQKADAHLAVRYRSIHSSVRRLGESNEEYREESWPYTPALKEDRLAEWIRTATSRYVPLRDLSDVKQLREAIQFYRMEADAPK